MRTLSILIILIGFSAPAFGQYGKGGKLYSNDGKFLGNVNNNQYDPNSISNPYGKYGNKYSPDSVNNEYGQYGNKYSPNHVPNPGKRNNQNQYGY